MAATECPKCGYIRRPEDTAPDYECPRCGIVYAKYLRATPEAGRRVPDSKPRAHEATKAVVMLLIVVVVAGAAIFAATSGKRSASTYSEDSAFHKDLAELQAEYAANEVAAYAKYNGKMVSVSGVFQTSGVSFDNP